MKMLRTLFGTVPLGLACVCIATTAIQATAVAALWAGGAVTKDKLVRYAAVIYGLDLTEVRGGEDDDPSEDDTREMTRDEILDSRVKSSPLLGDRQTAVVQGTDDTHILFQRLQSDTERFDQLRSRFDTHLAQLELDIRANAIKDLRETLEILQPRQSKDLLLRMLSDEGLDAEDDVVADVVTIIKGLPQDKLKKLMGEFKTATEQEKLHRILMEIGEFTDR